MAADSALSAALACALAAVNWDSLVVVVDRRQDLTSLHRVADFDTDLRHLARCAETQLIGLCALQ